MIDVQKAKEWLKERFTTPEEVWCPDKATLFEQTNREALIVAFEQDWVSREFKMHEQGFEWTIKLTDKGKKVVFGDASRGEL